MRLEEFNNEELRQSFYPMFLQLMEKGYEIEAFLFILSTWNSRRFGLVLRTFNIDHFENIIKQLTSRFDKIKNEDFKTINFDKYSEDIKIIFSHLASIKGIEKTGTTKLMHLKVPQVFVMWDSYIRNHYGFRNGDADDYLTFLKEMQRLFSNAEYKSGRTLAKVIDEHNYKTITEPILNRRGEQRVKNKK